MFVWLDAIVFVNWTVSLLDMAKVVIPCIVLDGNLIFLYPQSDQFESAELVRALLDATI